MTSKRSHVFSAIGGALIAVLVLAMLPATAANGDPLKLGEKNTAKRITKVNTKNGVVFSTTKAFTPAATFQVQSGAPIAVNSAGWVMNFNADYVDGFEANQLVRAGWCGSGDATDGVEYSCSIEISAPTSGVLLMSGSIDFWLGSAGADLLSCMFKNGSSEIATTRRDIDIQHPGNQESDCATDGALVVGPGDYTINFVTESVNSANLGDVGAYVLFVPFDGAGGSFGG